MALAANALTLLATVKADLGITVATFDAQLERLINAASDLTAQHCVRVFERNTAIVEEVAGYGLLGLLLSRPPLNEIISVSVDGEVIDADDYSIGDAGAGILHREGGWEWTALGGGGIASQAVPGSERKLIDVTYDGGWVTPAQAVAMAGTPTLTFAATAPATITRSAGSWVTDGFASNLPVTITGATTAANNGTFRIGSVAALALTLAADETLTAEGPTASCTAATVRGLPFDLENAVIDLTRSLYLGKRRDPAVTSEHLLSWGATYGAGTIPTSVAMALNAYRLSP